jgi:hypothetical protein
MTDHYRTSLRERVVDYVTETSSKFLVASSALVISPYIVPSVIRTLREADERSKLENYPNKFTMSDNVTYTTGIFTGFYLDFLQVMGYSFAVDNEHPEVLGVPIITNIASALYERVRNRRAKPTNQDKAKTLDNVV